MRISPWFLLPGRSKMPPILILQRAITGFCLSFRPPLPHCNLTHLKGLLETDLRITKHWEDSKRRKKRKETKQWRPYGPRSIIIQCMHPPPWMCFPRYDFDRIEYHVTGASLLEDIWGFIAHKLCEKNCLLGWKGAWRCNVPVPPETILWLTYSTIQTRCKPGRPGAIILQ